MSEKEFQHKTITYETVYPSINNTAFLNSFHRQTLSRPALLKEIEQTDIECLYELFLEVIQQSKKIEKRFLDKYFYLIHLIIFKILDIQKKNFTEYVKEGQFSLNSILSQLPPTVHNYIFPYLPITPTLLSYISHDLSTNCSLSRISLYDKLIGQLVSKEHPNIKQFLDRIMTGQYQEKVKRMIKSNLEKIHKKI